MPYTYEQLKGMTVAELREIAAGIENEAVTGYTQLNKEHLLAVLCKVLNIEPHARHKVKAASIDKGAIKSQVKALKVKRDAAVEAHDRAQLKMIRRQMHELRRTLRKAAKKPAK